MNNTMTQQPLLLLNQQPLVMGEAKTEREEEERKNESPLPPKTDDTKPSVENEETEQAEENEQQHRRRRSVRFEPDSSGNGDPEDSPQLTQVDGTTQLILKQLEHQASRWYCSQESSQDNVRLPNRAKEQQHQFELPKPTSSISSRQRQRRRRKQKQRRRSSFNSDAASTTSSCGSSITTPTTPTSHSSFMSASSTSLNITLCDDDQRRELQLDLADLNRVTKPQTRTTRSSSSTLNTKVATTSKKGCCGSPSSATSQKLVPRVKRQIRKRHGFCTECPGIPVELYSIQARNVPGECYEGHCLVCHPQKDPKNHVKQPQRKSSIVTSESTSKTRTADGNIVLGDDDAHVGGDKVTHNPMRVAPQPTHSSSSSIREHSVAPTEAETLSTTSSVTSWNNHHKQQDGDEEQSVLTCSNVHDETTLLIERERELLEELELQQEYGQRKALLAQANEDELKLKEMQWEDERRHLEIYWKVLLPRNVQLLEQERQSKRELEHELQVAREKQKQLELQLTAYQRESVQQLHKLQEAHARVVEERDTLVALAQRHHHREAPDGDEEIVIGYDSSSSRDTPDTVTTGDRYPRQSISNERFLISSDSHEMVSKQRTTSREEAECMQHQVRSLCHHICGYVGLHVHRGVKEGECGTTNAHIRPVGLPSHLPFAVEGAVAPEKMVLGNDEMHRNEVEKVLSDVFSRTRLEKKRWTSYQPSTSFSSTCCARTSKADLQSNVLGDVSYHSHERPEGGVNEQTQDPSNCKPSISESPAIDNGCSGIWVGRYVYVDDADAPNEESEPESPGATTERPRLCVQYEEVPQASDDSGEDSSNSAYLTDESTTRGSTLRATQPVNQQQQGLVSIKESSSDDMVQSDTKDLPDQNSNVSSMTTIPVEFDLVNKDPNAMAPPILSWMRVHDTNLQMQVDCLTMIWKACKKGHCDTARSFLEQNALDDIIRASELFPDSQSIRNKACIALWSMCVDPLAILRLGQAGASQFVVDVLDWAIGQQNDDSIATIEAAIGALHAFSTETETRKDLSTLAASVRVLQVMEKHTSSGSIQKHGCAFLSNCAVIDTMDSTVLDKGRSRWLPEIKAVVRAMVSHPHDVSVMSAGCMALKHYTSGKSTANLAILCHLEEVVTLLPIMESLRSRLLVEIQQNASTAGKDIKTDEHELSSPSFFYIEDAKIVLARVQSIMGDIDTETHMRTVAVQEQNEPYHDPLPCLQLEEVPDPSDSEESDMV